jgi:hypothetical protein
MKSDVRDLLRIVHSVYRDACAKCITDVFSNRDLMTIESRVKQEGMSFLTISLPRFCRDFEKSLDQGYIGSNSFLGFKKLQAIPALLQGMLSLLFDIKTGRLYDEAKLLGSDCSGVVDGVRQICLTFKKLELECTPTRVSRALSNFELVEQAVSSYAVPFDDYVEFIDVSHHLWRPVLYPLDISKGRPRHGPGATAERVSGNRKYAWRIWHERLEPFFPFIDNAYSISAVDSKEFQDVTFLSEHMELPVRVSPVPKTMKAPRIIAIEPCCMQYVQQGIREMLYKALGESDLTRDHVNFRDQTFNQRIALSSSKSREYATLDLSDASDRVPRDLALEMFSCNPDLQDAIDACRSTRAELPDGTVIPLAKFSTMGNALCFPIEAMYFYTICVMALLRAKDLPITTRNIFKVSRDCYVYGDDIIVPSRHVNVVVAHLQKYNCKVNDSKSFWNGNFRESCGMDAFLGETVTPTYIKKCVPDSKRQAENIVSLVKTANLFYLKGYWQTSSTIFEMIEKLLGPLPWLAGDSDGLGRISFLHMRSAERWNKNLHRLEVKAWCVKPVYRADTLEGYAALEKSLSRLSSYSKYLDDSRDASHLARSARHGAVALRRRWVATL